MASMNKIRMLASPAFDSTKNNGLDARIASARSAFFVASQRFGVLSRESADLQHRIQQQYAELLLGGMKQQILINEIKMHCLKGNEVCSIVVGPSGTSKPRPYGLLIQ